MQRIATLHCTHDVTHSHIHTFTHPHPSDTLAPLLAQDGKTPLELAANDEVKTALVEHAEHSDITDDNKNSLLLVCARLGLGFRRGGSARGRRLQRRRRHRLRAVLQAGANAAHTDQNGRTALMLACENKHEGAAAELMEATYNAGALDLQDNGDCPGYKRSALHVASEKRLAGTVAKLLSLGADAALADKAGKTPLELADNDQVKAAFAENTIITDDNKNALLLSCARLGLAPLLRAALQAGANAAHTDQDGCTALILACENKHEVAAAELMEATKLAGALDLQAQAVFPKYGMQAKAVFPKRSALHVAAEKGLAGTVAKLLALGADAALTDEVRACAYIRTR